MAIDAVVFDLDGVVRHWDLDVVARIELRHGLVTGALLDAAFGAELGEAAVTGALSYEEWLVRIADAVGSTEAVEEWRHHRGTVDHEAQALVEAVRASGCMVGVLSNATTRLEEDLDVLGIDCFDRVFNTARLGVCKPYPAVFQRVLELLGLPGERVVFTDDLPDWAEAATTVGMHGIAFTGVDALRTELRALDVAV